MDLTREQAIKLHKEMWTEMADEIEKCKKVIDVPSFKSKYCINHGFDEVLYECFLCEYTKGNCILCPLDWGSKRRYFMCESETDCIDSKGLWIRCKESTTWQEQAALARQIANLPERMNV